MVERNFARIENDMRFYRNDGFIVDSAEENGCCKTFSQQNLNRLYG